MSNGILGVMSPRSGGIPVDSELVEPLAMWIMNLGMALFFVLYIWMDTPLGQEMGAGVLLAVLASSFRCNRLKTVRPFGRARAGTECSARSGNERVEELDQPDDDRHRDADDCADHAEREDKGDRQEEPDAEDLREVSLDRLPEAGDQQRGESREGMDHTER